MATADKRTSTSSNREESQEATRTLRGEVVKLDRGYPLVAFEDGSMLRCEHATALVKGDAPRAVIGDVVDVAVPESHEHAVIVSIEPRRNAFIRKDPAERTLPQVLAANFDLVIIAQPLSEVNLRRLDRELVLAHETGARVAVVLTKADLATDDARAEATVQRVSDLSGPDVPVLIVAADDSSSIEAVRTLIGAGQTAILIGRSGVGKSSLINVLVGHEVLQTGDVRSYDGKGRHTTVSREIVILPGGGRVVDMPGVRGLGLWDADQGIEAAFADIEEIARRCRFRDCKHRDEPGCAVRDAVDKGILSQARFESYRALKSETEIVKERREQARWQKRDVKRRPRRTNR